MIIVHIERILFLSRIRMNVNNIMPDTLFITLVVFPLSTLPIFPPLPLSHVLTTIVIIKPFSYRMQQKSATNLVKQTQKTSENTPSFFTCHF